MTHPITPPCCSSTNTREWSFASLYRREVSDERPRPDLAPESCEGATRLEGRMSSLQNILRGKRCWGCDRPLHPRRRSWRCAESKCGKCDCRRGGYLANRLHN